MPDNALFTRTALALGLRELLSQLERRIGLSQPLTAYVAGGMAVHLYTGLRVTNDVDVEFAGRVLIPDDLTVDVAGDVAGQFIYLDTNYNPMFSLLHEDYRVDALPVELGLEHIQVRVLTPLDLAVSKIARFAENDREDIQELVRLGLTTADEIEQRGGDALKAYIGGQASVQFNLRDAVSLARAIEAQRPQSDDFVPPG
jgi:hypothetical protein